MGFVIDDEEIAQDPNSRSPLIGLYSAFKDLDHLGYEKAFVLPCDVPLVKFEVIDLLIQNCKQFDCCVPNWRDNLLEPLLAIYPIKKAYETSRRNIRNNQYNLTKIINADWRINFISIEDDIKKLDTNLLSFKNINILDEIKIFESSLNKNH
jgi:molybdopterin-guanine dinucleotide biosynthesis protein A